MKRNFFSAIALFLSTFYFPLSTAVHAVPPLPGITTDGKATCHVNRSALNERLTALGKYAPGFAPPIVAKTYKVAVVRIDFSDKSMTKTQAQSEAQFANVRTFFSENSYGLMSLDFTVTSVYRMSRAHSFYANGINSQYSFMANEALALASNAGFSLTGFDHVMIYHAGDGAETTSNANIWSAYLSTALVSGPTIGAKVFPGTTFVPETEGQSVDPLGVVCHEYGHQLGLPDLYNTASNSAPGVGKWSLMDSGIYIGSPLGSNPSHLDAWSKLFLGFNAPQNISFSTPLSTTMAQAETTRYGVIRIPIEVSDVGSANEYFLLEYRRTSGASYDTALPASGLLVWHIDDAIATDPSRLENNTVNIAPSHRGVDLVEADNTDVTVDGGGAGDAWTTTAFGAPFSNAYNGVASQISATSLSGAGGTSMSFTVTNGLGSSAEKKTVTFDDFSSVSLPTTVGGENITAAQIILVKPDSGRVKGSGIAFDLSLPSGLSTLPEPVELVYNYNPATIAARGLRESLLRFAFHNGTEWVIIADSSVDTTTKKVKAKTKHFSEFQVVEAVTSKSMSEVIVFPNPAKAAAGHDRVNFNKIPDSATIKIYSVSGHLVRELKDDGDGNTAWFLINDDSQKVESGVYFAVITSADNRRVVKVAVQR